MEYHTYMYRIVDEGLMFSGVPAVPAHGWAQLLPPGHPRGVQHHSLPLPRTREYTSTPVPVHQYSSTGVQEYMST